MKTTERQPNWTFLGTLALTAMVAITAIYFGAKFGSPYLTADPVRNQPVQQATHSD